jgi:hypothetical protein
MASPPGRGAALDVWQRQAVLSAAALLREHFGVVPTDSKVKTVHDMLLEVVDPPRRAQRMQREMASAAKGAALTMKSERRGHGRRARADRRVVDLGSPTGVERRAADRRKPNERRVRQ